MKFTGSAGDSHVRAAAQWILWYGQSLFQLAITGTDPTYNGHERAWHPGPLYHGTNQLSLDRWHFWRDGYRAVASVAEEKGFSRECMDLATRAATFMDAIETVSTF